MLADYPFGALQTIQELAERTGVSAPSITRFVSKIGFGGYQEFQRELIAELSEGSRSPVDLKASERLGDKDAFLATMRVVQPSASARWGRDPAQDEFDRIVALVADPARSVFLIGGGSATASPPCWRSISSRFARGSISFRPNPEQWPDLLLEMRKQDVLVLFDFRRYQPDLAELAALVCERRRAAIVLITDKWMSPVARYSDHVVALPIEIGTAWDTLVGAIAFVEALIVKVSEADWPATRKRLEAWDALRLGRPGRHEGGQDRDR